MPEGTVTLHVAERREQATQLLGVAVHVTDHVERRHRRPALSPARSASGKPSRAATLAGATRPNPTSARLSPTYSRRSVTSSVGDEDDEVELEALHPVHGLAHDRVLTASAPTSRSPSPSRRRSRTSAVVVATSTRGVSKPSASMWSISSPTSSIAASWSVGLPPADAERLRPGERRRARPGGGAGSRRCRRCCGSCRRARSGSTCHRACRDRSRAGTRPGRRPRASISRRGRCDRAAARAGPARPG